MQHTLFISDLHLNEKYPMTTQFFLNFLENHAPSAQALYILGDFFDVWVGDDDETPYNKKIKTHLKSLTDHHIPVYFLHGNRDFLIGKQFALQTGCKILQEFTTIHLYGKNVLLLHGDALCTLDKNHMKFRKLTQNTIAKNLFLYLPLGLRRKIGAKLRAASRGHHVAHPKEYLDVVHDTILQALKHHAVSHMIHGHIHKPSVYNFTVENTMAERIVLGSWDQHGCALKWYANGKREMCFFDR